MMTEEKWISNKPELASAPKRRPVGQPALIVIDLQLRLRQD
jgi:hypothetical protein